MTKVGSKYMINVYFEEEEAKKIVEIKARTGDSESSIVRKIVKKSQEMKQK